MNKYVQNTDFFLFGDRNMGKTFPILQNPRLIYRGVNTTDV